MAEETIAMTQKAIDRLSVIQQVVNRQLRQREAAVQLGLSIRQVKRLVARFRQEGPFQGWFPGTWEGVRTMPFPKPCGKRSWGWSMSATPTLAPRWPVRSWWSSTVTGCRSRRCDSG